MPTIKQLQQKAHEAKVAYEKSLNAWKALDAKAERTAEEEATLAKLDAEVEAAGEALKAASDELAQETKRLERERLASAGLPALSIRSDEPDPALTGGFASVQEFARAVRAATPGMGGSLDQRLVQAAATGFHQGNGTDDGYLLPPAFRDQIWELVLAVDDVLTWVDSEPTAARQIEMLADESTPWGAGGIQVRWEKEGAQGTPSRGQAVDPRQVMLHKLFAFVLATEDLLEDAPRLANRLTNKAALAIRWKIGNTLIYGSGVGQPLGWFKSPAKITVPKTAGQAAKTLTSANVLDMYTRLLVQPGDSPFWMANRDIVPQLATLMIGEHPMWTPPVAGLREAPGGMLLGLPIRWSEYADTLGTEGDLQLLSPKGYYAPVRQGGVKMDTSIHLYFDQGLQAFRWSFRLGGQPHLSKPVEPAKGATTKSHFVTLATRA